MAFVNNPKHVFLRLFFRHRPSLTYQVRFASRGLKRQPLNVFTAEEADAFNANKPWSRRSPEKLSDVDSENQGDLPFGRLTKHKRERSDEPTDDFDAVGAYGAFLKQAELPFGKTSDPKAKSLDQLVKDVQKDRAVREKHNATQEEAKYQYTTLPPGDKSFSSSILRIRQEKNIRNYVLLEGHNVINDAFKAGVRIDTVYFINSKQLNKLKLGDPDTCEIKFKKVQEQRLRLLSDMSTPYGQIAIAAIPKVPLRQDSCAPLVIVLDDIRDPGDMGTLIRTAGVAGCELLVATKGCVDIWNSKVLRAGGGAHFRIPILHQVSWQYVGNYIPSGSFVNLVCNHNPTHNQRVDTLSDIVKSQAEFNNLDKFVSTENDANMPLSRDKSYIDENVVKYQRVPLPRLSLFDLDIEDKKHVTCIISGSAHGASGYAKKMTMETQGVEVFMPNANQHIAGTNVAVMGCLGMMEARRQLYKQGLIPNMKIDPLTGCMVDTEQTTEPEVEFDDVEGELKEEDFVRA